MKKRWPHEYGDFSLLVTLDSQGTVTTGVVPFIAIRNTEKQKRRREFMTVELIRLSHQVEDCDSEEKNFLIYSISVVSTRKKLSQTEQRHLINDRIRETLEPSKSIKLQSRLRVLWRSLSSSKLDKLVNPLCGDRWKSSEVFQQNFRVNHWQ